MQESEGTSGRWIDETLHDDFRFALRAERVLHESRTDHQHLVIFENASFGRVLMLDGIVQLSECDEFIYHEMLTHVPLFAHGAPADILIIGGGDGGVLREALKHQSVRRGTLCEIDRGVVDLSQKYFPAISAGAFDDPRSELVIADGTRFVAETEARYDVIIVDSTDPVGPGQALFTHQFYSDCKRCLKSGGVLVTQNGLPFHQGDQLRQSVGSFRQLFADASAYLMVNASYVSGPMALGWASDDVSLRHVPLDALRTRYRECGLATRCYTPEVHQAAFALPPYVQDLVVPAA